VIIIRTPRISTPDHIPKANTLRSTGCGPLCNEIKNL
jgi:hypothetical protein